MLRVDRMREDPVYRDALAACGLHDVEKVLANVEGRIAAWSRTTDTTHIPGTSQRPGFYVKRYFYPTWIKRFRTMLRGTYFGVHRGQSEYRALESMRAVGISAVRPVAYGARRIANFVTACFLITEEVPDATNLTTFAQLVAARRRVLPPKSRQAMIDVLADEISRMHELGFSHGQLYWRNILVRMNPDRRPEFFLLDAAPRRWRQVASQEPWWQRELSHLAVSALPFTTRSDRLRFLLRYFGARRLTPDLKLQAQQITLGTSRWHRHETQRIKMNGLFDEWNRQWLQEESLEQCPDYRSGIS